MRRRSEFPLVVLALLAMVASCRGQRRPATVPAIAPPSPTVAATAARLDPTATLASSPAPTRLTPATASPPSPMGSPATEINAAPLPSETPTLAAPYSSPAMILVEAGTFEMGSADGHADEQPIHPIQMSRPFLMAAFEVTWEQYDRFCTETGRTRPAGHQGWGVCQDASCPAAVSWIDAIAFCNWLSIKEGFASCYSGSGKIARYNARCDGYRLPTEAEWEYAARGGSLRQGFLYAGSDDPDAVAWFGSNSGNQTHPVGLKVPNELGLYDLSGNAWEWCWDWYGEEYYAVSPEVDPAGPSRGETRVRRSGSWLEKADTLRVTYRSADNMDMPFGGIRPVRTAGDGVQAPGLSDPVCWRPGP